MSLGTMSVLFTGLSNILKSMNGGLCLQNLCTLSSIAQKHRGAVPRDSENPDQEWQEVLIGRPSCSHQLIPHSTNLSQAPIMCQWELRTPPWN